MISRRETRVRPESIREDTYFQAGDDPVCSSWRSVGTTAIVSDRYVNGLCSLSTHDSLPARTVDHGSARATIGCVSSDCRDCSNATREQAAVINQDVTSSIGFARSRSTAGGAGADCEAAGRSGRVAEAARPSRPPHRRPHPRPLPRNVRRPGTQIQKGWPVSRSGERGTRSIERMACSPNSRIMASEASRLPGEFSAMDSIDSPTKCIRNMSDRIAIVTKHRKHPDYA